MPIVERTTALAAQRGRIRAAVFAVLLLTAWLASTPVGRAHPISQGALEVLIFPQKIELKARVSAEETLLATALVQPADDKNSFALGAWEDHGRYLLKHLYVFADGQKLAGRLMDVIQPDETATPSSGRVEYVFEYDFVSGPGTAPNAVRPPPAQVRLEQDVLRDIESVPGQPWEATFVVRIGQQNRAPLEGLLLTTKQPLLFTCDWTAGDDPGARTPRVDRLRMGKEYLRYGFMHILAGWDHLLFVGALALAVATLWDLIKVITAFTLAHTLTLTLAVLDLVRLPERVVEPMIAASIVLVALQNLFWPERSRGASRLLTAFFFGLFHGLGFAGGLLSAMEGMQGTAIGIAIAAFSIGVEAGHQAVVLPVFALLKQARRRPKDDPGCTPLSRRVTQVGSALILLAGLFYFVTALM